MRTKSLNILFIICGLFVPANINCQWFKSELAGNLKEIVSCNQDTIAIVGTSGVIYLTTDGGLNWENISLPEDDFITDAQFISNSKIYVTSSENFWISDNQGIDWKSQNYANGLTGLKFFNDSLGIFSAAHDIYKININSNEMDTVWSMEDIEFFEFGSFSSMIFSNDSTGFAIATIARKISDLLELSGIIIETQNSGNDWSTIFFSDSILFMNNADLCVNNNRLYAFEDLKLIYTDVNLSEPDWHQIEIPFSLVNLGSLSQNNITSVFYTSLDTGYLTISPTIIFLPVIGNGYDIILKTFDNGKTWYKQLIDTIDLETTFANPSLSDIIFLNDSTGIACGYNKIFETNNGGNGIITDVREKDKSNSFRIAQIKDQLIIDFNEAPNNLDISICNLNGRFIKRINENGSISMRYEVDLKPFENGIYIINVIVNRNYMTTEKILLFDNY
jgi:hypothetical protein